MSERAQFTALIEAAERLFQRGRWGDAARAYELGADYGQSKGAFEPSGRAWDAAGEAWRRDDWPVRASQAFSRALVLAPDGAAGTRLKLAAVLADLGEVKRAAVLCDELRAAEGMLGAIASDAWVNHRMAMGRLDGLDEAIEGLCALSGPVAFSGQFRRVQWLRLGGSLSQADALCTRLLDSPDRPAHPSATGALWAERAEVASLQGRPADAVRFCDEAVRLMSESRRRALSWSVRATRSRILHGVGVTPLLEGLDDGIRFARARSLRTLCVDLTFVEASVQTRECSGMELVYEEAVDLSLRFRAGRAALILAERSASSRAEWAARACGLLRGNAPYFWQARAALWNLKPQGQGERAEIHAALRAMGVHANLGSAG